MADRFLLIIFITPGFSIQAFAETLDWTGSGSTSPTTFDNYTPTRSRTSKVNYNRNFNNKNVTSGFNGHVFYVATAPVKVSLNPSVDYSFNKPIVLKTLSILVSGSGSNHLKAGNLYCNYYVE